MCGLQEPVVAGGDDLILAGIGQQIPRKLFAGELIKRNIAVQGIDDVIAVRRNIVGLISVVTDRVRVAHQIEPIDRQSFAIVGRCEQEIDFRLHCCLKVVAGGLGEALDPFLSWRQTHKIEVKAAE